MLCAAVRRVRGRHVRVPRLAGVRAVRVLDKLLPGTAYAFKVQALNALGAVHWADLGAIVRLDV
mgnify:CR=1 FL=1